MLFHRLRHWATEAEPEDWTVAPWSPHSPSLAGGFPDAERGRKVSEEKFSDKFRDPSPPSVHQAFTKASTTFQKPSVTFPEASVMLLEALVNAW